MCQRLYIASYTELPRIKKTRGAPYLDLQPLGVQRVAVRRHFPASEFPHLYLAEGHERCGCGFPEELKAGRARKITPEEKETMERLAEAVRVSARARPRVRLLLCFLGDEEAEATEGRTVTLGDLQDWEFRFRNLEIVTVVKAS